MHLDLKKIKFLDEFFDKEEFCRNKENDDNFYFFDAEIFMSGHCDIFAYSLKNKYKNYKIYTISKNGFTHYFCTRKGKYIDARGIYDSIEIGLNSIKYFKNIKNPQKYIELLENYEIDENEIWKNTLLNFANEIINSNEPLHFVS